MFKIKQYVRAKNKRKKGSHYRSTFIILVKRAKYFLSLTW